MHSLDKNLDTIPEQNKLRERFIENGGTYENFTTQESLESILYLCMKHKKVHSIACKLTDKYDTLDEILQAPLDELSSINGISAKSAAFLNFLSDIYRAIDNEKPPRQNL